MKKVKKYLAFAMAMGLMLSSMTVLATEQEQTTSTEQGQTTSTGQTRSGYKPLGNEELGTPGTYISFEGGGHTFWGSEEPNNDNIMIGDSIKDGDMWVNNGKLYSYNGSKWIEEVYSDSCDSSTSSSSGSSGSSSRSSSSRSLSYEEKAEIAAAKEKAEAERKALEEASIGSVILEAEAAEEGFENAAQMQDAQAANKTVGEYYNNAVLDTQGIEDTTPVAQGGNLIVDGKATNMTASISKVSVAFVDSVRASREGTVLNVVDVQFPATEATINFYMPGVTDGANIAAVQYKDGAWTDVDVKEVRADHVILDLKSNGIVAFLGK